jgi:hypothetical protein
MATRLAVLCVLTLALATCVSCYCSPAPSISSISPSSATAGGGQFVLTINGNNFNSNSMVAFNGSSVTPSFVNSHQLVATIPATDIAYPGALPVLVLNPSTGGTTSSSSVGGITTGSSTTATCDGYDSNAASFTVSR